MYRHESLTDGDEIETSALAYPKLVEDRALVETKSCPLYPVSIGSQSESGYRVDHKKVSTHQKQSASC
jgi:hypothetical protein